MFNTTDRVLFLLGSGFSKSIGLPLSAETTAVFCRDNRNLVLNADGGEFFWRDQATFVNELRLQLTDDHIHYGYILNELVARFIAQNSNEFNNYEEFYQYIADNSMMVDFAIKIRSAAKSTFGLK